MAEPKLKYRCVHYTSHSYMLYLFLCEFLFLKYFILRYSCCTILNKLQVSLHGKKMGKQWKQWLTLYFLAPKSLQMMSAAMKLKDSYSLEGKL